MRTALFAVALASSLAGMAAPRAHAMSYSYRMEEGQIVVNATGEIMPNEVDLFTQWASSLPPAFLKANTPIAKFVFDSPGGNVVAAKSLALMIHNTHGSTDGKDGFNTEVARGGMCASACVLLWAAGVHKSVAADARVGVHMTSQGDSGDTSLFLNGMIGRDLASVGAPASVVAAAVSTPGNSIYWLTPADLAAWNVNVVSDNPQPAALAVSPSDPPAYSIPAPVSPPQPAPAPRRRVKVAQAPRAYPANSPAILPAHGSTPERHAVYGPDCAPPTYICGYENAY